MNEFFSEETLKHPPSLPKCGQIRSGNKSDLIGCIEEVLNVLPRTEAPAVEAAVLEGSVVVNMVNVKKNQSFQTYASDEFKNHVTKYEREYHPDRIDIKFDTYQQLTLKMATRTKRGKGVRRRLQDDLIAPTNCHSFLRLDENKIELFFTYHNIWSKNMVKVTSSWFLILTLCQFHMILMQTFHLFYLAITRKLTQGYFYIQGYGIKRQ